MAHVRLALAALIPEQQCGVPLFGLETLIEWDSSRHLNAVSSQCFWPSHL